MHFPGIADMIYINKANHFACIIPNKQYQQQRITYTLYKI